MHREAIIFFTICLISSVQCWDNEELEIFDLVEEINKNFYEVMGISQDASSSDIRRAFRNLSVILHPDKNSREDANVVFRNLVSIYEVLKDPSKREKYNTVLKDGLPNWKSALYYYRRVRKMGLAEGAAIVFIILTIGQYFVSWAVYIERKYTMEQILGNRVKKLQKQTKGSVNMDSILSKVPSPSIFDTLPFQIPKAIWNLPKTIKAFYAEIVEIRRQKLEEKKREKEEEEQLKILIEEIAKEKEEKKQKKETVRKRKQAAIAPVKTDEDLVGYSTLKLRELSVDDSIKPVTQSKTQISGGFWSDEDLLELIRLVKRYPGGTIDRWEIIAETMSRNVSEVTFMAAKLKETGYKVPGHVDSVAEIIIQEAEAPRKVKTKKAPNPILVAEATWSQEQQAALETAIVKYPKTNTSDRWQKISSCVSGKTKEECLARYKYLVELVKFQKGSKNKTESVENDSIDNNGPAEDTTANKQTAIKEENDDEQVQEVADIIEEESTVTVSTNKGKGKPRNKRKERRKRMEFSSSENDEEEDDNDDEKEL